MDYHGISILSYKPSCRSSYRMLSITYQGLTSLWQWDYPTSAEKLETSGAAAHNPPRSGKRRKTRDWYGFWSWAIILLAWFHFIYQSIIRNMMTTPGVAQTWDSKRDQETKGPTTFHWLPMPSLEAHWIPTSCNFGWKICAWPGHQGISLRQGDSAIPSAGGNLSTERFSFTSAFTVEVFGGKKVQNQRDSRIFQAPAACSASILLSMQGCHDPWPVRKPKRLRTTALALADSNQHSCHDFGPFIFSSCSGDEQFACQAFRRMSNLPVNIPWSSTHEKAETLGFGHRSSA